MMLKLRSFIGSLAIAATLASAGACNRSQSLAGDVVPANSIGVHVVNQNFQDVDVYAISDGLPTRLGTVTGNGSQNFVLDASMSSGDLRLVATPIGGNGRAASGPVAVGPGQVVEFRIGPYLRNSSAYIR